MPLLLFSAKTTACSIVPSVVALVSTCHTHKYNLIICISSISSPAFLIVVPHKTLFAELDYTNASFPLKCQMASSNSTDPLSQSLEPTVRTFFLPLWFGLSLLDVNFTFSTKQVYHVTLLKA